MSDAPDTTRAAVVLHTLDDHTVVLLRLAARIAAGDEPEVRAAFAAAQSATVPLTWVDELVLQSYLFSGFPRALNAAREWRRLSPVPPSAEPSRYDEAERWRMQGETTCAAVYGPMYDKLRRNIEQLHPALDEWMVVEGYGKVLSRPGLDLPRRELCIVAACAATGQDRQLHSHLHGALNVGVSPAVLERAIEKLASVIGSDRARSAHLLLARVLGK